MSAFIGIASKGSGNLSAVAPGVAEALVATAGGLLAAIPAVIAYNIYVNRVRLFAGELEGFANELIGTMAREGSGLKWRQLGGGLGSQRGELPLMADVNVTALVDVMLVMLITFMITAPMMQGGVDVELPRAEARPLSPKEGMVVSVNRNGRIFVDQTPVSYSDFRVTFRSLVATRKPSGVYLQADARVPYGEVVRVLAIIRTAGVQNVGLVAAEEESP